MDNISIFKDCVIPLLSALFGVFATVFCTSYREYKKELERKKDFLGAILGELCSIKALFEVREKEFIESDPTDIFKYNFFYYELNYDYVSVFENSCDKIGIVGDFQVVQRIICTYMDIKSFFEQLKIYQELAQKGESCRLEIDNYYKRNFQDNKTITLSQLVNEHYYYGQHIKNSVYPMTKEVVIETINSLNEFINVVDSKRSFREYLKTYWH